MVYCGKPSRACLECRVKRRKCDFSKPSCGQCVRARSSCAGYRDQVALAFRDQSMDVVRSAQTSGKASRSKRSFPPSGIDPSLSGKTSSLQTVTTHHNTQAHLEFAPQSGLAFSIEEQAVPFFFHHYVDSERVPSMGHIDCLALICGRAASHNYLFCIIEAIGMASLSNLKNEPNIMFAAIRKYSLALERVRAGLAEPSEAMTDQMLICIMLLTLYETVTYDATRSISSWENHIDGALTLLQLRGTGQLNYMAGRHLFLRLRTEVLVSCLQRITFVPQVMLNCMSEAQRLETGENMPSCRLANIIVHICALRATMKSFLDTNTVDELDSSIRISEALSIDRDLAEWSNNLPSLYDYSTTMMTMDREDLYLGLYHTYSDPWVAYTWNLYRCARVLLNQTLTRIIRLHLQFLSVVPRMSSYGLLLDNSNAFIHECTTEILLSVPFVLGGFRDEQDTSSDMRAAYGLYLLWPLYIAGSTYPAKDSLREWAIFQLEKIGDTAGLQKAKVIATMLKKGGARRQLIRDLNESLVHKRFTWTVGPK